MYTHVSPHFLPDWWMDKYIHPFTISYSADKSESNSRVWIFSTYKTHWNSVLKHQKKKATTGRNSQKSVLDFSYWWQYFAYLPSRCAAPPSVTVLTNIPSFSSPASAPTPIPIILIPSPSSSMKKRGGEKP